MANNKEMHTESNTTPSFGIKSLILLFFFLLYTDAKLSLLPWRSQQHHHLIVKLISDNFCHVGAQDFRKGSSVELPDFEIFMQSNLHQKNILNNDNFFDSIIFEISRTSALNIKIYSLYIALFND